MAKPKQITVVGSLNEIARRIGGSGQSRSLIGGLDEIAQHLGPYVTRVGGGQAQASSDLVTSGPFEEGFIRYSKGKGTFRANDSGEKFIIVTGDMYKLDGERDGIYQAVFQATFQDEEDLIDYPKPPEPTFDKPSRVEPITDLNQTKAKWTFADGSSLSAPGPALSKIAALKNGGFQFWVSAAAFITNGEGRYEGAIGEECSLGSTYFSGKPDLSPGTSFEAIVVHTFKVILGGDRGTPPAVAQMPKSRPSKAARR